MMPSAGKLFRAATRRWLGPTADPDSIVKVTVRNEEARVVRVLTSERDLAAFRALWAGLVEVDPRSSRPPPEWRPCYRLSIERVGRGGRTAHATWFYSPVGGYIQMLAIIRAVCVAPLYRRPSPDAFEAILRPEQA